MLEVKGSITLSEDIKVVIHEVVPQAGSEDFLVGQVEISSDGSQATVNVKLNNPGDKAEFEVVLKNTGNVAASVLLDKVELSNFDKINASAITLNDIASLPADSLIKTIQPNGQESADYSIEWNPSAGTGSADYSIQLKYVKE